MPKPKKVGRPKLAKGEAKAAMVRVRATPDELRAFDRAAKASGQKRSEWIRSALVDFKMTAEDWKKVLSLFGKARDGYDKLEQRNMAKKCDDAIALVQHIALDSNLQGSGGWGGGGE